MASRFQPPSFKVPFVDERGLMTMPWVNWFRELYAQVNGLNDLDEGPVL